MLKHEFVPQEVAHEKREFTLQCYVDQMMEDDRSRVGRIGEHNVRSR